jgi:pSer/pThr/pTyr-binding forkhead associated (FHA) protein
MTGPGNSITFEHPGPVIRIGRDPECELSLQGEASTAVSRRHAVIEMRAEGATLADTGSSNGTLLNGKPIENAVPLRVGDRIQMGYTGATLTVLELDLSPGRTADTARGWRAAGIGALAAAALAAVVLVVVILLRKPETPGVHVQNAPADIPEIVPGVTNKEPQHAAPTQKPEPASKNTGEKEPVRQPVGAPPPKPDPSAAVKEVGSYVAPAHSVSLLLQRQGEAYPWLVLPPDARVSTATTLVSLPGYRSFIEIDRRLVLTLWGNLPEFSWSPVLESVVMLHNPSPGVDLEFTLDRGRVVIVNQKEPAGPARVRLHFLSEEWAIDLSDPKSEIALELWTVPRAAASGSERPRPLAYLNLFTKGKTRVSTPQQNVDLSDRSCLVWDSASPGSPKRLELPEQPGWWEKPPDRQSPEVRKALASLLEWCKKLGASNADPAKQNTGGSAETTVVETIKTEVLEGKDLDNQDVAILFLAALDEIEPLLELLERPSANVRGVTRYALQSWLSRGRRNGEELTELLVRRGNSKPKAERIVQLLHFLPKDALDRKETYQRLIDYLDDDKLVVRDLAFWHLSQLGTAGRIPEQARGIDYDPTWERERRQPAVERWKRLVREGQVPSYRRQ